MDTNKLKKFAQAARNLLIDQVTSRLDQVLDAASVARRENPKVIKDLEGAISKANKDQVIEQVAYTWFNRFTALRFMDVKGYTSIGVVSPTEGQIRPEILSEAMAGHIDDGVAPSVREQVTALLDGRAPSSDPQGEAYRLLLVVSCNQWHGPMPFLFEKIDDYTELLMPGDLLSQTSILSELREVMTPEACQDVEIIGWLYQFYISEKKDGLKKNQKITAENIPAATQLFTPHWIVRYLVENSLGRLWLLNKPESKLAEKMDYYIAPEEPETDFLEVSKPEDIRICDPAAGSGHMLTYAFDLLYAIYEEEGYDATEIPVLILEHNLTGVEIDDRAGALAAFALTMKAAAKLGRRRFLRMEVKPDICVMQNVSFTNAEMQDVMAVVGKDLFTDELRETLGQFEQAKNFGSLIVPKLRDPAETLRVVEARDFGSDLLLKDLQARVVKVLCMAEALSPKYHVVVANPPYAAVKGLNGYIQKYIQDYYPQAKIDLFACFIERSVSLTQHNGYSALVTMQSWMFLSSLEKFRHHLLLNHPVVCMAHLGRGSFDSASAELVATTAFCLKNGKFEKKATYVRLTDIAGENQKSLEFIKAKSGAAEERITKRQAKDFDSVAGSPVIYWASRELLNAFAKNKRLGDLYPVKVGLQTGSNAQFVRDWFEVRSDESVYPNRQISKKKWFPYNKGGGHRKWFGNHEHVVNWENDGHTIKTFKDENGKLRSRPQNVDFYMENAVTWSFIGSSQFGVRFSDVGAVFDVAGSSIFPTQSDIKWVTGLLNSKLSTHILAHLNPTINFQVGDIQNIPIPKVSDECKTFQSYGTAIQIAKSDWDTYETSWDFTTLPLLSPDHRGDTLETTYARLRDHWQGMTDEMKRLEEENNRIFIDAYGLQDELTPEVPIDEITLTCNPQYRYGGKLNDEEREARLLSDTVAEFLSYSVGCMFGRYSLDKPGLILANQGETLQDYLARVPEPRFMPDADNVIPVLDGDWFPDDITERFRLFLRTTFGEPHFRENLKYIEDALGKDIRKYFTMDFYAEHVKRYKKRPIYWMFSSPKGTFNALIYMHRYRADTVSVLLNDYLREFINKLESERARLDKLADDESANQLQRTKAVKDTSKIATQIDELRDWERDVIFPLAQQKIEIDLDDGVKVNYPKFGTAFKKIPG